MAQFYIPSNSTSTPAYSYPSSDDDDNEDTLPYPASFLAMTFLPRTLTRRHISHLCVTGIRLSKICAQTSGSEVSCLIRNC